MDLTPSFLPPMLCCIAVQFAFRFAPATSLDVSARLSLLHLPEQPSLVCTHACALALGSTAFCYPFLPSDCSRGSTSAPAAHKPFSGTLGPPVQCTLHSAASPTPTTPTASPRPHHLGPRFAFSLCSLLSRCCCCGLIDRGLWWRDDARRVCEAVRSPSVSRPERELRPASGEPAWWSRSSMAAWASRMDESTAARSMASSLRSPMEQPACVTHARQRCEACTRRRHWPATPWA